jgi:uncharacterized cysteine cluster protein YcgN (CxxCxxCC family)
MPYFKDINLLFIHIPKTSGSIIDNYFYKKLSLKKTIDTLYSYKDKFDNDKFNNNKFDNKLQYTSYSEIFSSKINYFNIKFNNLKIMTLVRSPYSRIISSLFQLNLIDLESCNKKQIEKIIENYLYTNNLYDNSKKPQYLYLTAGDNLTIPKNIIIIKHETMSEDMVKYGYDDFINYIINPFDNQLDYMSYLSEKSISMINHYYFMDFKLLNYELL